jgi:hypothetical protein
MQHLQDKIQYLTEDQVARLTKLSPYTLRGWRHQGKGPCFVRAGRCVRYSLRDVIDFMEGRGGIEMRGERR